jgi:hypothetical protein
VSGKSAIAWAATALYVCAAAAQSQSWTATVVAKNFSHAPVWVTFYHTRDFPLPPVIIGSGCVQPGESRMIVDDLSWTYSVRGQMTKTADCSPLPNNAHVVCDAQGDAPKMGPSFAAFDMIFKADASNCGWTAARPGTRDSDWSPGPLAAGVLAPLPPSAPGPLTSKGPSLGNGQTLVVNQYLQSPGNRYFAIMQTDGNLCVYKGTPQSMQGAVWCDNKTWSRGPFVTVMQADGNLCTYVGTPTVYQANLWCSSKVAGSPSYVAMQDDGNLCVYKGAPNQQGGAVWCHNTNVAPPPPPPPAPAPPPAGPAYLAMGQSLTTNQFLQSANNRYYAIVQSDGNLCVYRGTPQATGAGGAIWCLQRVAGGGQFVLAMQSDGNLCEYVGTRSGYSRNLWCSNTQGQNFLVQQGDGNLCVYRGASPANQGAALWCHNTNVGR